jgi:hypothetical protein
MFPSIRRSPVEIGVDPFREQTIRDDQRLHGGAQGLRGFWGIWRLGWAQTTW